MLPACELADGVLSSHDGLTFGGLVIGPDARLQTVIDAISAIRDHARRSGRTSLIYRQAPSFLGDPIAGEDAYALQRAGAVVTAVEPNFVIDLERAPQLQERRARAARKAIRLGVETRASSDLAAFWHDVLEPVLAARHAARPTHSLAEIELLAARFPGQITLEAAYLDGRLVAGTVVYGYRQVLHCQYIAAAAEGRSCGALDLLFERLIERSAGVVRFLSLGIATEERGSLLNTGLAEWKEGFGARALPHFTYELLP